MYWRRRACRLEELSDSLSGLRQRAKAAEDERDRLEGPKEVRRVVVAPALRRAYETSFFKTKQTKG